MQAIIIFEENNQSNALEKLWDKSDVLVGNESIVYRLVRGLRKNKISKISLVGLFDQKILSKDLKAFDNIDYLKTDDIAKTILSLVDSEEVILIYSNLVINDKDLKSVIESNKSNLVLLSDSFKDSEIGLHVGCKVDVDKILKVYAHPRKSYFDLKVCGIFKLQPLLLNLLNNYSEGFDELISGAMPSSGFYLESILNDAIEDGIEVFSLKANDKTIRINHVWDVLEANEMACKSLEVNNCNIASIDESALIGESVTFGKNVIIGPKVIIGNHVYIADNTTVTSGAIIGDYVIIGKNSLIENYAYVHSNTVIGDKNKIGYMAEVSGVTFTGVSIVHSSHISGVVGKYVDIGAATIVGNLKFDDSFVSKVINGKTFSNKYLSNVFIGNYVRTGIGVLFNPGVIVEKYSCIGPGVNLIKDVESNSLVLNKQELVIKAWGPSKYGWK